MTVSPTGAGRGAGAEAGKPPLQQIGDDPGEGGEQDIRTDSVATSPADPVRRPSPEGGDQARGGPRSGTPGRSG